MEGEAAVTPIDPAGIADGRPLAGRVRRPLRPLTLGFATPTLHADDGSRIRLAEFEPLPDPLARSYALPRKYLPGPAQDELDPSRVSAFEGGGHAAIVGAVRAANTLTRRFLVGDDHLPPGGRTTAEAVIATLDGMARAGSMTGRMSGAAFDLRTLVTPALAMDYVLTRDACEDTERRRRIERWLRALAAPATRMETARVMAEAALGRADVINNHHFWAGYGALAAGAACADRRLFDWGRRAVLRGLDRIDRHGLLAGECRRGVLAIWYHAFAAEPLILGAYVLEANGSAPTAAQMAALARLMHAAAEGVCDAHGFERRLLRAGRRPAPQRHDEREIHNFAAMAVRLLAPELASHAVRSAAAAARPDGRSVHGGPGWVALSAKPTLLRLAG